MTRWPVQVNPSLRILDFYAISLWIKGSKLANYFFLFAEQEIQAFGPPPQENSRHEESPYSPWKEPQDL